ncbi:hypothetical protein C1646_55439 [Rhizophagus diaphanus]|nr:hypothetical protein C1646_55439 [Rhizophagus diaphanus] [Rhizophagus sp. MUCL 43196]
MKEDLKRQQQFLLTKCLQHELISDIGSGINFKRLGLRTILEQASRGMVAEVDYVDSHMILSNTFLNSMVQDSWFSHKMAPPMTKLNSVRISLPSTLSLSVGCKENGQQGLFRVYLFILYLSNN